MELFLYGLGITLYFIIGRVIVELKWYHTGFPYFEAEQDIEAVLLTAFWPIYLFYIIIRAIALLILELIYRIFNI
jgi:hypothetical protein